MPAPMTAAEFYDLSKRKKSDGPITLAEFRALKMKNKLCPNCDKHKPNVEFKTNTADDTDVLVCEDCYNELEDDED